MDLKEAREVLADPDIRGDDIGYVMLALRAALAEVDRLTVERSKIRQFVESARQLARATSELKLRPLEVELAALREERDREERLLRMRWWLGNAIGVGFAWVSKWSYGTPQAFALDRAEAARLAEAACLAATKMGEKDD